MKNRIIKSLSVFLVGIVLYSCQDTVKNYPKTDLSIAHLIPKPLTIKATNSSFVLAKKSNIQTSNIEEFKNVGLFLAEKIKDKTGLNLAVNTSGNIKKGTISIKKVTDTSFKNKEGYELIISEDLIVVNALTAEGAFRAVQTIRQLIPYTTFNSEQKEWIIATGSILDEPNFEYRGAMLDVSRHFFDIEVIKKYVDVLAYYKMNYLHLHLSDDQGWRIEIKSWPKLTEIGASTQVGGGKGGFYTQKEYTEIVNYAAKNYITIVPEIDMPGHTHAAYTAYPQLDGTKNKKLSLESTTEERIANLYTGTEVGFSTFDTRSEEVYNFIDNVIGEIAQLTPGPYIHIGGDESLSTAHKDYEYFVERVEKNIQKHNKILIGWDEVATANITSSSVAQFWASEENAQKAGKKGMKVILSPAKKIYLDMKYDRISKYGLHWAAFIPVDSAYSWTPETYVKGLSKENILGVEAPLWSETISTIEGSEYLAFPRLLGVSEVGWSVQQNRNWNDYKKRLANQTPYFNEMDIKYYPSKLIDWVK